MSTIGTVPPNELWADEIGVALDGLTAAIAALSALAQRQPVQVWARRMVTRLETEHGLLAAIHRDRPYPVDPVDPSASTGHQPTIRPTIAPAPSGLESEAEA